MIKSMTGYGGASEKVDVLELTVELKSVNNRYLDVSVRLPRAYIFAEEQIKSTVGKTISRGKVDVFVTAASSAGEDIAVTVNEVLASRYVEALRSIEEKFGLCGGLSSVDIARFPEVLTAEKTEIDRDEVLCALMSALEAALRDFDAMRTVEGEKMSEDITGRLDAIGQMLDFIEERSPQTVAEYREKLLQRMTEILDGKDIDESRILTEAAIFADKWAVDEETVRLRSHIAQFRAMLADNVPVGRKLDFLIQEMNRETNTIGSKCSDIEITRRVVDIKAEIEKIREQIQNVE